MNIDWTKVITAEAKEAAALAEATQALRAERDRRLAASDWAMMPDVTPPGGLQAWQAYRQALRDLPDETVDPASPLWPVVPGV
ncbi:tail fiber assembly protein [Maritimibacter alkaliphilus]|uniref:tail fiber assembly protein n=1 Tax=Maritimibacter alkaliphilus TaxID=404236 RepID=UPI001C982247|nr:tail fiber assembly protein [Maritimibacter alkaliphilus]MBY6091086.1 phage tail assembly chaperone [Maritimibacter alkaliphilus]